MKLSESQEQNLGQNVYQVLDNRKFSDQCLGLDTSVLNKFVDSYLENMHSLHPFLDVCALRNSVSRFGQQYPNLLGSQAEISVDKAIILLVLALGEVLKNDWWNSSHSRPGMPYFVWATRILEQQPGQNTITHAQAHILAALYLGQFSDILKS